MSVYKEVKQKSRKFSLFFVPEGHPKIARQFIAGIRFFSSIHPVAAAEVRSCTSSVLRTESPAGKDFREYKKVKQKSRKSFNPENQGSDLFIRIQTIPKGELRFIS